MRAELWLLYAGGGAYLLAGLAAIAVLRAPRPIALLAVPLGAALVLHGVAIVLRWQRLDHGPYVNLFEILSSNVWTLHATVLLFLLTVPALRKPAAGAVALLQVLVVWLLLTPPVDAPAPVTYQTVWLPVHAWLGKAFLGVLLVATGGSALVLWQHWRGGPAAVTQNRLLDEINFRLVLLAFVFETLMLAAGAAWAQDAWGRYWDWDPLETWSFITWLAVGGYLHARVTFRPAPPWSAVMIMAAFVLAFLTFYGVPFISTAPHKGMV